MILYLLNYAKGILQISVTGSYLERFFNLCSTNNIKIWNINRIDFSEIHLSISVSDYKKLKKIIDKSKCSVNILTKFGLPFTFLKFKKRYALILGCLICIVMQYALTNYLFAINITGTENTALVYDALAENGIKIGQKISDIEEKFAQNSIIKQNEEFLWMSINIKGNMATVEVLERSPLPEIVAKDIPCDIIAEKTGLIDSIDVLSGEKMVDVGHTFLAGDILVSSEPKSFPQLEDISPRYVHSIANIKATIWYDLTRVLSNEINVKQYTGKETTKYSVVFGEKEINLYKSTRNPYPFYDKIIDTKKLTLSPSVTIPIYIKTETYIEYTPLKSEISSETGYDLIESNLMLNINDHIDGDIINTQIATSADNNTICVKIALQTLENIGIKTIKE